MGKPTGFMEYARARFRGRPLNACLIGASFTNTCPKLPLFLADVQIAREAYEKRRALAQALT